MASARNKLNKSYFMASIVIAAFLGLVFQSWWVFWIASVVLIAISLHSGGIRLSHMLVSEGGWRKVLRDFALGSFREFFGRSQRLNIASNLESGDVVQRPQSVSGFHPAAPLTSESLSQEVASQLPGVQGALDGFLIDRPRRRILRNSMLLRKQSKVHSAYNKMEVPTMASARNKLNESYFMASIVISAFLGLVFQSWWVFWIAVLALIAGSLHSGEIRLKPRPQHRRRK